MDPNQKICKHSPLSPVSQAHWWEHATSTCLKESWYLRDIWQQMCLSPSCTETCVFLLKQIKHAHRKGAWTFHASPTLTCRDQRELNIWMMREPSSSFRWESLQMNMWFEGVGDLKLRQLKAAQEHTHSQSLERKHVCSNHTELTTLQVRRRWVW